MKTFREFLSEDGIAVGGGEAPTNSVAGGGVAGLTGEPPVSKKRQKQYADSNAAEEPVLESENPYLLPAVKYNGRIFKGDKGWYHNEILERYNIPRGEGHCGFVNHKGHFLDRDQATAYARENGLDPAKERFKYTYGTISTDLKND